MWWLVLLAVAWILMQAPIRKALQSSDLPSSTNEALAGLRQLFPGRPEILKAKRYLVTLARDEGTMEDFLRVRFKVSKSLNSLRLLMQSDMEASVDRHFAVIEAFVRSLETRRAIRTLGHRVHAE